MSETLELARQLIARSSVTPEDAGCQAMLMERLARLGFAIEKMPFGKVSNFWARHGKDGPLLVFAGHTDVVPSGPEAQWTSPPFSPEIRADCLFGRGAADMKGSLAAMVTACERFLATGNSHRGAIGFLITSDEEGPAVDGTRKVIDTLQERGEHIDWCLVGEPTSKTQVGDLIKNGRRGSLNGRLRIQGVQGHIAYPQLAQNPIHLFAPALTELVALEWDQGNAFFPPTSLQISNLNAGTGADNVIPGTLEVLFNFRYSTATDDQQLKKTVSALLDRHHLKYELSWKLSGRPFLTQPGSLVNAVGDAIREICHLDCELSTDGGTSDGRFIAPAGAQVVELGPVNATIHKIDECVSIRDLNTLSLLYERILHKLLGSESSQQTEHPHG